MTKGEKPIRGFCAPAQVHDFHGFLFDNDGTIIDSTAAIIKFWHELGKKLGVDGEAILAASHGVRTIETLRLYDESLATWEYVNAIEAEIPKRFGHDAVEIPGSRMLLDQMEDQGAPWAIVTSGSRPLVEGWLGVMKLAHPKNLVVAEDVEKGKPDPACYILGGSKLGLPKNARLLVFEDAPSGVRAGKAAGFEVLAVATTHSVGQLQAAGADWIVRDQRSVRLLAWDDAAKTARIEINNALQ